MAKPSKEYWNRRMLQDKARVINNAERYLQKEQKRLYSQTAKEIEEEIEKLYETFADQQNITLAEAKRRIRDADFKKIDFDGLIQESLELQKKIREGNLPEEVLQELERQHKLLEDQLAAFSKRGQISYLDMRRIEIEKKLLSLYDTQQQNIYDYLQSEYEDSYYRQVYNTQQQVGHGYDFVQPNAAAVDRAILNTYNRENFSKTLYAHCKHFSKDLRDNLTVGLIRGESLDKMARRIQGRMGVALSAAKRLVRTETAYVYEQATKAAYEESGVEWYEYMATLDNKTSEVCQDLDGKHFRVKDAKPGENYPPMHPNCRSTTVCFFPEDEEKRKQDTRIARDENGRTYEVPASMTYREWARKHTDGMALLTHEEKGALNQYMSFDSYRINEALRSKRRLTENEKQMVSRMDSALEKLEDYQGVVVRCLDIKDEQKLQDFLEKHQVGKKVRYREYTPCSTEEGYNPEANIIIYRQSTKGKNMTGLNPAEKEVLYKRDSRFKVENVVEQEGVIYIMEEEI